ncbi:MAG: hypothetical protein ACKPKO_48380, partial [Candidatus Fonsibacter sp.]
MSGLSAAEELRVMDLELAILQKKRELALSGTSFHCCKGGAGTSTASYLPACCGGACADACLGIGEARSQVEKRGEALTLPGVL